MKIVSLDKLDKYDFAVTDLFAMQLSPKSRVIDHTNGRFLNGFVFLNSGECSFTCSGKTIVTAPDSLVYLPAGSPHVYRALTDKIVHIRVDFRLYDYNDGEEIVFSEGPMLLFEKTPTELLAKITDMARVYTSNGGASSVKCKADLMKVLSALVERCLYSPDGDSTLSRVYKAVRYVENHSMEEIDFNQLAKQSRLSVTHFRRMFKSATGMTPLEYRTHLRIEAADRLLSSTDKSIGEIAESLGFESIYYFSRVYKKHIGVSPSRVRQRDNVEE